MFKFVIVTCLSFFLLAAGSVLAAAERPNFVIIMADDLGAAELGCYGNRRHHTPELDQLAADGMRFRTCYSTPLCSPTRIMIMTGRYAFRTGWFNFYGRVNSPKKGSPAEDIGEHEITFGDILKSAGYATGIAGKWQLPGTPENRIRDCGFDEHCMWLWLHDLADGTKHSGGFERPGKPDRFWHPGVMLDGKYRPTTPEEYGPDIYTDFVIDFIRKHKDRPFCVYFPMCLTHNPWDPTPDLKHPGKKTPRGLKYNVEYMDHLVGRIVKELDMLGLRENTFVLFTGDNGTKGAGKGKVTEMGARVPLIVSQPGAIPAGVVSDELVDLTDVLPTIADWAGAPLPSDRVIDGQSLGKTLRGEPGEHRPWIFSYLSDQQMLRDKRWLLEGNGQFYDCGDSRNGRGYKNVTKSSDPEVRAARQRFAEIVKDLPGPENYPNLIRRK